MKNLLIAILLLPLLQACAQTNNSPGAAVTKAPATATAAATPKPAMQMNEQGKVTKTEDEWKKLLDPEQYRVLRQKGTERPHTGEYDQHFESGVYTCAACGNELFASDTKFDAHCGWPSFNQAIAEGKVEEHEDRSYGMIRTEVVCARCGGHLGHVFDDGPKPTGMRYCINSVSLSFVPKKTGKE